MTAKAATAGCERFWFSPAGARNLALVRIVCCALFLLVYATLDIRPWARVPDVFWAPVSLFHFLAGPPRNEMLLGLAQTLWKLSLFTSAIGLCTRFSLLLASALGFFVLGLPNCFGKIHHLDQFTVLLLVILLLSRCSDVLAIDRLIWKRGAPPESGSYTWPIRIAQTMFLLIFFAAGVSKLRQSGGAWMEPGNMRSLLLGNFLVHVPPTQWALFLVRSDAFCIFAAAATIAVELSAFPAIFLPAVRVPVVAGLFMLQTGIALLMGIYFLPHLAGFALFIPWARFYGKVARRG